MSRYRKFTTICCAAVLALGLAACGGGDDGLNTSQEQELQEQKNAADEMVAELQKQLAALQERLGIEGEEDPGHDVANLRAEIERLEGQIEAAAEQERMETEKAAAAAMAATAAKLYAGISAPNTVDDNIDTGTADTDTVVGTRHARHAVGGIEVLISDNEAETLSEDKDAMVADNHGWQGKKYTAAPKGDGMYEAVVYSNVGDPTQGEMFSKQYRASISDDGVLNSDTVGDADNSGRVASPSFDQSAGIKRFPLPKNDSNPTTVAIPGSFHGVDGTYSCTPGGSGVCAVRVADKGFQLGKVTSATDSTWAANVAEWTFKPADVDARVTDAKDDAYASYGWWIHKAANDGAFTASAFVDEEGTVDKATGLNTLKGTATYMGGAAGKYALASSTGGTNDAGHFTARATLEANFTKNTDDKAITGMIDMFMGADGMPRDWSVKLNGSPIMDTGEIGDDGDGTAGNASTVWTIGEDAAKAAGSWTGTLRNNGKDDVPQVATGTFNADYGLAGKMVGAFGANVQ